METQKKMGVQNNPPKFHAFVSMFMPHQTPCFGCGVPTWRKTYNQNSFCVGVVGQTQSIQHLVQTKKKIMFWSLS